MKRLVILTHLLWFLSGASYAQNDLDMLRYSQTGVGGDARFLAMGGSMGALGANLSCANYNPAGLGLYRKGEMVLSGGLRFSSTQAAHYGTITNDFKTNAPVSLLGFSTSWEDPVPFKDEKSKKRFKDWSQRHTVAFTFNKIANFNSNVTIQGNTYQKTIIDDFLGSAQGYAPEQLNFFYEGLAFNTYLIDTIPYSYNEYGTYFYTDKSFKQSKYNTITGGINEYSLAYAYAKDNKNYLGISVGIPSGKWNYSSEYIEEDLGDSIEYFKSLTYHEYIQTRAIGINLKIGGITRVSENLRLGAYLHTPTAYSLNDVYSNQITARYDSILGIWSDSSGQGNFRYKISSPMRAGASVAYLYEKILAFNVDAEYVNYPQGRLSSSTYPFTEVNTAIRQKYKSAVNMRFGVELNTSPVVFRLGYASYGSPFGNMFSGKMVRNSFSGGVGFRQKENRYFDIALVFDRYAEDYYIYNPALINVSNIKYKTTNIVITYGIKF